MNLWVKIISEIIFAILAVLVPYYFFIIAPVRKLKKAIKDKNWDTVLTYILNDPYPKSLLLKISRNICKTNFKNPEIFPVIPLDERLFLNIPSLKEKFVKSNKNELVTLFYDPKVYCLLPPIRYAITHSVDGQVNIISSEVEFIKNLRFDIVTVTICGWFQDKKTRKKLPIYFALTYNKKTNQLYLENPLKRV